MNRLFLTLSLIIFELFNRLFGVYKKETSTFTFPEKIGEYNFVEEKVDDTKKIFKFAIYKKGTERGFAKILEYKNKNFEYYSLLNEYKFYKFFLKNSQKIISDINIPKLLKFIEEKNKVILLTEWVDGENIEKISIEKKIIIYKNIINFCQSITPQVQKEKDIPVNSLRKTAILFPLLLLIATILYPKKLKLFLKIFAKYFTNFFAMLKTNSVTFVHKSLEDQNILQKNDKIFLIDFQLSALSFSMSELSQILFFSWHKKQFIEAIIQDNFFLDMIEEGNNKSILQINSLSLGLIQLLGGHSNKNICFSFMEYFLHISSEKRSLYETVSSFIFGLLSDIKPNRKKLSRNIILCYHSISNHPWRFATKIGEFEKQIAYLNTNYNIVSLEKILKSEVKNALTVTFDDGYLDIIQYAYPILEKYNIKATLFILGDNIQPNRKELDNNLPLLSIEQIKILHANGWEIGFHTNTHANLSQISKSKLEEEIIIKKQEIEKRLGFPIKYFAYPRGIYTRQAIDVVRKAGYSAAFTVDGGYINFNNPLLIPRVPMEGRTTIKEFQGLLSPTGITLSYLFMSILKLKEKMRIH